MQTVIFLIICTLLMLKPSVNALFIDRFGASSLPLAYILTAVFAALVTGLYAHWLRRLPFARLMYYSFVSFIVALVIFGLLLRFSLWEDVVLFIFYLWVAVFALLSASQFWILANQVFQVREAKRLFSFIGAGAIAGGLFGGFLTTLLAPLLGSENIVFVCAALLCIVLPLIVKVQKTVQPVTQIDSEVPVQATQTRSAWHMVREIAHLRYLAIIIGLSVFVAKLVDYQFSAVASEYFPEADQLAAFFGFWFSVLNILSLLIQLFLTRRVVGVLGVGWSLFFLPVGIFMGAALLIFAPELWVVVLLKVNEGSLKQSVHKAAMELLALPIPNQVKQQTKTFVDVFVDSIATGLSGLVLIFVVSGLELSTPYISVIILLAIGLWLYYGVKIRQEYLKSFQARVQQLASPDRKRMLKADFSHSSVLEGLRKVLQQGGKQQILFVLHKLTELEEDRLWMDAVPLLHHHEPEIRQQSLRYLYVVPNQLGVEAIRPCLYDESLVVRTAAFSLLTQKYRNDIPEFLAEMDAHPSASHHAALLLSLARESRGNPSLQQFYGLTMRTQRLLERPLSEEDTGIIMPLLYQVIGWGQLNAFYPVLEAAFQKGERSEGLLIGMSHTLDSGFAAMLLSRLDQATEAKAIAAHLSGMGEVLLEEIRLALARRGLNEIQLLQLPAILARIPRSGAVRLLLSLLEHELMPLRSVALQALQQQKERYPQLKVPRKTVVAKIVHESTQYRESLSVLHLQLSSPTTGARTGELEARESLVALLKKRLEGNMHRIFGLLALQYSPKEIHTIHQGLQQSSPELRQNALEYLDNLLHPSLKRLLVPLIETSLAESISEETIERLGLKIPNEQACFESLLKGRDFRLKLALLYLIGQQPDRYHKLLQLAGKDSNPKIRDYAARLLSGNVTPEP